MYQTIHLFLYVRGSEIRDPNLNPLEDSVPVLIPTSGSNRFWNFPIEHWQDWNPERNSCKTNLHYIRLKKQTKKAAEAPPAALPQGPCRCGGGRCGTFAVQRFRRAWHGLNLQLKGRRKIVRATATNRNPEPKALSDRGLNYLVAESRSPKKCTLLVL